MSANSLTRRRLADELAKDADLRVADARRAVDATIGLLAGAMIDGRRIELRGFGTFDVRPRRKTRRRSPGTGKMMAVPPGLFVRFRAVPGLLATLEACGSARPASRKA